MTEPSWAERARTEIATSPIGHLATLDVDGRPVVGPVPIIDDGAGAPVTVLSNLSTHIQRGRQDHRGAISIGDRVLLQGDLRPVPGLQQIAMQPEFLRRHPHLAVQVESLDYSWLRLEVTRVRWTDDDGTERWLRPEDIAGAAPDPLGHCAPELVADIAERVDDDLLLMIRGLSGHWLASSATLLRVDRYGLVCRFTEPAGTRVTRVGFPV
ncbi:MAG: pyridoxamine 5'-phosphate oxidase family protein, partial [Actinomycetota bacterium]|nr:pyridoxamine 5'-phosphate oxidase family protein [Actinomycetota bacterium]